MSADVRVSVVVPTCNRSDFLGRCLDALLDQDFSNGLWEIIIADDGRSEATRHQVDGVAQRVRREGLAVRYVRPRSTSGPAAARNAGWRAARGEIVAFTDDDCIPASDWLSRGVEAMAREYAMVGGRVHVPPVADPTDYERNAALLGESQFVTANCIVRQDVLETLGGFDERFRVAWREDTDLLFRAMKDGFSVGSASDAVVSHPIRPAPWGISVSQQRKSLYNALLFKKHPSLYRECVQARPPWRYYRIVGALLTCVVGTVTSRRGCTIFGFSAWTMLTALFCRDRLRGTRRTPSHIVEMAVTSAVIPPLSIYWRIRGAIRFRVLFL